MIRKRKKKYWEMTTDELAEATKEFDQPFIVDKSRPLTRAERAWWERIKRGPGRPRKGKGVSVISVSVEKDLLKHSDALARKMGLTRAALIERGLKAVMAAEGQTA